MNNYVFIEVQQSLCTITTSGYFSGATQKYSNDSSIVIVIVKLSIPTLQAKFGLQQKSECY